LEATGLMMSSLPAASAAGIWSALVMGTKSGLYA
jgi:hypothetical protein